MINTKTPAVLLHCQNSTVDVDATYTWSNQTWFFSWGNISPFIPTTATSPALSPPWSKKDSPAFGLAADHSRCMFFRIRPPFCLISLDMLLLLLWEKCQEKLNQLVSQRLGGGGDRSKFSVSLSAVKFVPLTLAADGFQGEKGSWKRPKLMWR